MKTVLTIAGSDSSGGAGLQADLKAIAAHGAHGLCVVTAVTAQNTLAVAQVHHLPAAVVDSQLRALFDDIPVHAVKSGMLGSAETIAAIAERLTLFRLPYVLDPVMASTTGAQLLPPAAAAAMVDRLFPLATLVTPNAVEAAALAGFPLRDRTDAELAGKAILAIGAGAVLVKGGHLPDDPATDVLVTPGEVFVFPGAVVANPNTHGTGCTLASAVATRLAHGCTLHEAVRLARAYVAGAIAGGYAIGAGPGPVDPFYFQRIPGRPGHSIPLDETEFVK